MSKPTIFRSIAVILIACAHTVPAAEGESKWKLEAAREIYQGKLDQLDKEHGGKIDALLAKYRNALTGHRDRSQKDGDLQGVLDAKKELERLDSEKTPPSDKSLSSHAKMREIQSICAKAANDEELAKSRKIVDMAKEYTTHLEEEKKRLTIAGDFEGAKAYSDEIDRISKREKEQAAIRLVKAGDIRKPTNAGTAATASTVKGDCKIHSGPNPPPIEGVELERQSMMGTRMGGRISQIDVTAELGVRNNMVEERSRSDYSRTKTESGKIDILVRLSLKGRSGAPVIENPLVLVQYFGTDAAARGIIKPKQIESVPVSLPSLSAQNFTIDFPAISVEKYESRYRADYSGTYTTKSGTEYRGFMVTVFDKGNQIIYQTASHNSLQDLGELAIAESKLAVKNVELNAARRVYERARDAYNAAKESDADYLSLQQKYFTTRDRYFAIRSRMAD